MELKLNSEQAKTVVPSKGKIVISTNPVRIREMLDKDGNVINPKTKQIIKQADNS